MSNLWLSMIGTCRWNDWWERWTFFYGYHPSIIHLSFETCTPKRGGHGTPDLSSPFGHRNSRHCSSVLDDLMRWFTLSVLKYWNLHLMEVNSGCPATVIWFCHPNKFLELTKVSVAFLHQWSVFNVGWLYTPPLTCFYYGSERMPQRLQIWS
jgi:hypothetical protein